MKSWWGIAFGVLGGLCGAGLLWLVASPPRGEAVTLKPAPPPAPLLIHVEGAVTAPGVYSLAPGSRVEDAVEAAGGLREDADAPSINLAARLFDGAQLRVPARQPVPAAPPAGGSPGNAATADGSRQIDINTATQPELETLPGIGPATAEKILTFRQANGPFAEPADLQRVSGIGPATYERIKDLIVASGSPLTTGP